MTAPAKTPRPATGLPPARAGRGTTPQDVTSVAAALDRAASTVTKASGDAIAAVAELLTGAQELTAAAQDYKRFTGLAETWETEAAQVRAEGGDSGAVTALVLEGCAGQLRGALAYGGAE